METLLEGKEIVHMHELAGLEVAQSGHSAAFEKDNRKKEWLKLLLSALYVPISPILKHLNTFLSRLSHLYEHFNAVSQSVIDSLLFHEILSDSQGILDQKRCVVKSLLKWLYKLR